MLSHKRGSFEEWIMIDFDNETGYDIDEDMFEDIFAAIAKTKDIELIIVTDERITELNKEHRGKDKATDVLSFPIKHSKTNFLGSVIISADTADAVAKELGHGLKEEIRILFVHGLLHIMGYDHETDNGQMRQKEGEIIKMFNLPSSLSAR